MTDQSTPSEPTEPQQPPAQPEAPQPAQPGVYAPGVVPPSNNAAVASMVVACCSLGLLMLSAGLAAPITTIASTIATFLGYKGREDVDQGKTTVQRDLAVGGFWTGIGGIVLSLIALAVWVTLVVLLFSSDSFWDDLDQELNSSHGFD